MTFIYSRATTPSRPHVPIIQYVAIAIITLSSLPPFVSTIMAGPCYGVPCFCNPCRSGCPLAGTCFCPGGSPCPSGQSCCYGDCCDVNEACENEYLQCVPLPYYQREQHIWMQTCASCSDCVYAYLSIVRVHGCTGGCDPGYDCTELTHKEEKLPQGYLYKCKKLPDGDNCQQCQIDFSTESITSEGDYNVCSCNMPV